VCLCLKFLVASIYDLPDFINCLFNVFAAARFEAVLFLSPNQQSGIQSLLQMICEIQLLID